MNTGGTGSGPPSQGGNEAAWLNAFLDAREVVLTSWGDAPVDGRVPMFRTLIGTGNFALTCPFTWSIYGDSFTMSTDPLPYGWTPGSGGGSTGGGSTTAWPNPAAAHNIGKATGQNSFNLGVGFDGDATYGTAHHDFTRDQIEAGLTIPGYYELNAAGEVLMSPHPGGGKTSNNTKYSRVEYRELERDGSTKAAWDPTKGRHYIKGRSAVDALSAPKPEMVVAQVHDASDDTAMIYRRTATKVEAKIGNSVVATLDSGAALTEFDDWMIEIVDGTINFYWNNMSTPAYSANFPYSTAQYFKAGAYMQWNLDNGDATIGKVRLVNLEHWHTGWPAPARPANQGGGSTGSGGGTGTGTGGATTGSNGTPGTAPAAFTAKYFVSMTGSDSNTGLSKTAAKRTIAAALGLATAGDTISVAAGTYVGNITVSSGGSSGGGFITIRSEVPRAAIISGNSAGSQSAVQINAPYVRLQELTITGTPTSGVRYGVDVEADHVEVLNCHIHQICQFETEGTSFQGGAGINFDQTSYTGILIDGNEINNIGPAPGTEQLVHGIYCGTAGTSFRIVNNLIYDCEDFGVHEYPTASSSGIEVVNNTIAGCGRGILHGNGGIVRNNIVYNSLSSNYDLRGSGSTVSNNFSGGGGNVTGVSGVASGVDVKFIWYAVDGTGDFRLQTGSPALSAGITTSAPTRDFAGAVRPQGAGVDAGCCESVSGSGGPGTPSGSTGGSTSGSTSADDGVEAAKLLSWGAPQSDSDEFNYTGTPNPALWSLYDGPGHAGNGTRDPSAFNVANGILTCTGTAGGSTGGMSHVRSQKYMRVEWRVRTYSINPKGSGNRYHPVLIDWPTSDEWPQGGEFDFYECDCDSGLYEAYLHIPGNDGSDQEYVKKACDISQWHNIAFEWSKSGCAGWLDGQQVFNFPGFKQPPGPMQLTYQLDNFFGSGMEPAKFEAQFCRIYAPPT
ncbi:MAG: polysaccharide lyase family 7 protein [Pseudonocardia sp.]|nr:polysaccharide lyase family 7 protein [Pseudonocardia sp.]